MQRKTIHSTLRYFDASRLKVGIVVSRFNEDITGKLLETALDTLKKFKVKQSNITVYSVPGAIEIPYALDKLMRKKKPHALVALGCIIRGETPHFEYVCKMATEGALEISLDYHVPVGFGVLTVNTLKQAQARIHVAGEAVAASLELAAL